MLKKQFLIITAIALLLLSGCVNNSQATAKADNKLIYQPVNVAHTQPVVKSDHVIHLKNVDNSYKNEQKQITDFDKYLASRNRIDKDLEKRK